MTSARSRITCRAFGIVLAVLFAAAWWCMAPQSALAQQEVPSFQPSRQAGGTSQQEAPSFQPSQQAGGTSLQAGVTSLQPGAPAPELGVQSEGDLQFMGLSGASVTGSMASGYTVYVRDGDTADAVLTVKNVSGSDLKLVTMTDSSTYEADGETVKPIAFPPHSSYRDADEDVTGAAFDRVQDQTSDTTGVLYMGFYIDAGATATFNLKIDAADLDTGTYDWFFQLGRQRFDYRQTIEYLNGIPYESWPCVGKEVEATYTGKIPVKVVIYNQPNAALKVGEKPDGPYGSMVDPIPGGVLDFGTIDLSTEDEGSLKATRDVYAINDSPQNVFSDAHGNTTSIKVAFGGEATGGWANWDYGPFSWGNGKLYDTNWSPLPPVSKQGNSVQYQTANYSVFLDATYLIAGTYAGNLVVRTTPHKVTFNGEAGNDKGVYRVPFTVKLEGVNPRLYARATNLVATPGNGQVELSWAVPDGIGEYEEYSIWRREGAESQTDPDKLDWSRYEKVGVKARGNGDEVLYVDGDVENGTTYSYTVICGVPLRGYAAAPASATPDASIATRLLAPSSSASSSLNGVEISWRMNDKYGGSDSDGSGMVDYFNIYRDGVLVDRVYQSAVYDEVSMGWRDDGQGGSVYGVTGHDYSWSVHEPVPDLRLPYLWTVSAVSLSGVEGYLDDEGPAYGYGPDPVIEGHAAYYDADYYYYDEQASSYYEGPANVVRLVGASGMGSPEEYAIWRSEGAGAPDVSKQPYATALDNVAYMEPQFIDRNVQKGKTYTYAVRAVDADGSESQLYTFTMKSVEDGDFSTPDVEWSVAGGTTARLKFYPSKDITASVYRDGKKLAYTPASDTYNWIFDVSDNPGVDGTYEYRVDYTCSGVTASRTFTFVRNTAGVDVDDLLKLPDAPALSGRTSGESNVVLSWTPASTGGVPEGYHVYRTDAGEQRIGGRHLTGYRWNGPYEYYQDWGNGRYITLEGADTLSFVDGRVGSGSSSSYYRGDSHLGDIIDLGWSDDHLPHVYWVTAYNRAGESEPSAVVTFDTHGQDEWGNATAPATVAEEPPAAPSIQRAWVDWEDGSTMLYFDPVVTGKVRVAWSDSGMGGAVDRWTLTYAGTHWEDGGANPPRTDELSLHQSLLDPGTKLGTSDDAPECTVDAAGGANGEIGRTLSVTVAAENAAGSAVSQAASVDVVSLPRLRAAPGNASALLEWTDLVNDSTTQVTGWEIWRKAEVGLWERAAALDGSIAHAGVEDNSYNHGLGYYAWRDSGLDNGWSYQYRVVAKCADGIDRSSVVRTVTPQASSAFEAPGAPRNLQAQVVDGVVYLTWDKPAAGGQVGYYCPQCQGEGIEWYYGEIGNVNGNSTSTTWVPNSPGTYRLLVWAYSTVDGKQMPDSKLPYQIEGYDGMDDGQRIDAMFPTHSNVVEVTVTQADIDAQPTDAPGDFTISLEPGDGNVAVSWSASAGAVSYTVGRSAGDSSDMPDVTIAAVEGKQRYTWVDETAEPGVRYTYRVTANGARYGTQYREGRAAAMGTTRDEAVAAQVSALIEGLPSPGDVAANPDSDEFKAYERQVAEVRELYDGLSDRQRSRVSGDAAAALDGASAKVAQVKYAAAIAPVQALIDADDFPTPAELAAAGEGELDDLAAVIASARAALDGISPAEARRGVDASKLVAAEQALGQARKAIADKKAAAEVDALIAGLPAVGALSLDDRNDVAAARAAYGKLGAAARGYVAKLSALEAAEARILRLEREAAAVPVANLISDLPAEVGLEDADAVAAARAAYDALGAEGQTCVGDALTAKLIAAERRIAALRKDIDDQAAADAVNDLLAAIGDPDSVELDDADAIKAALDAYGALSEDQKKLVDADALVRANDANARVDELQEAAAEQARVSIAAGTVKLSPAAFTYDGKAKKPAAALVVAGHALKPGVDFTVSYANNLNAGANTAKATLTGIGAYKGTRVVTFSIKQAANTLKVKAKSKQIKVKAKAVAKKKQTLKRSAVFVVKGPKGKLAFKKVSGNKRITVSKTGVVTLKKLKKGTYTVKVRVTATGNANYKSTSKVVAIKFRVR